MVMEQVNMAFEESSYVNKAYRYKGNIHIMTYDRGHRIKEIIQHGGRCKRVDEITYDTDGRITRKETTRKIGGDTYTVMKNKFGEVHRKNNKLHGLQIDRQLSTGTLILSNYYEGKLHGRYFERLDSGVFTVVARYEHGLLDGKVIKKDVDGDICSITTYDKGVLHGFSYSRTDGCVHYEYGLPKEIK